MKSRTTTYGMPSLCPWPLEDMEYDGCCSHSSLAEGLRDDFKTLTPEQMAIKEIEIEERQKEQRRVRNLAAYHELKRLDFTAWKAKQAKKAANLDPEKRLQYNRTTVANTMASRKIECKLCGVVYARKFDLNLHNQTKKHLDRVAGKNRVHKHVAARRYACETCDRAFRDSTHLKDHYKTQKHKNNAAKAAKSLDSSS
jgi:hypothetical protein